MRISCAVASWLFDEPGHPAGARSAQDDASAERSYANEERRRQKAALRAARKKLSSAWKEPEEEGKPISHWLEQYCDPGSRWTEDDEPAAAPSIRARDAVVRMGTQAVPNLMAVLEIEDQLGDCVADLLHELHKAGKVPDHVLIDALRGGPAIVRGRVLAALEPRYDPPTGRRRPVALSPGLVAALVKTVQDRELLSLRHMAASALGRPGLKDAVPTLTEALRDSDNLVRTAAASALAAIGPDANGAIPVLKSLAQASRGGERAAARSALLALGEKLADFYDFNERMASHFHERLAQGLVKDGTEAELAASFSGVDGVFFVVDRSGSSMQGLRFAQRFIPKVLSTLGEDAEFGIVFLDCNAESHPQGGKPAKARKEEKAAALEFVLRTQGGSGSCPGKGFEAALEFCDAAPAQRKVIIYIGDGGGTCRAEAEAAYLERMCDEVTRRNGGRVAIHAIGMEAGPCGQGMLLYLTERNGGSYTRLVR